MSPTSTACSLTWITPKTSLGPSERMGTSESPTSSLTRTGSLNLSRRSYPTTSNQFGSTRRTCATSRSSRAEACCEIHPQGLPGRRCRRRPRQPQARPAQLQDPRQTRELVILAYGNDGRWQDRDGRRRDRGAVLGERDVRLRTGPGCCRVVVFRRPEPEQANVQPPSAGIGKV